MRTIRVVLPWRGVGDLRRALVVLEFANHLYGRPPDLFMSGVRYAREPAGAENWQTWPVVLYHKVGDCEDLAAYLARQVGGRPHLYKAGGKLWHVVTKDKAGRLLDPSAALGMYDAS